MKNKTVLIFAPHPDDAEIFCGGTIAFFSQNGFSVTLADLTAGEMSSNGTLETRQSEKLNAQTILSVKNRLCLDLPDTNIKATAEQVATVVHAIRSVKPDLILGPYEEHRHPDHLNSYQLIKEAIFKAGLKKYLSKNSSSPFNCESVYWYMTRTEFKPSVIVDTTKFLDTKLAAINAYHSQITATTTETLIGSELTIHAIKARDAYYGSMIGVAYGEPLLHEGPLLINNTVLFNSPQGSNSRFIYPEK